MYNKEIKSRFLKYVRKTEGCWLWLAYKTKRGYGQFSINKKSFRANRISYELFVGKIPDGLFVCHSCDNPPCVNPDHLWLGTQLDNVIDRDRKGRQCRGKNHWTTKNTKKAKDFKTFMIESRKRGGIYSFYGKKLSESHRKKISKALMGNTYSLGFRHSAAARKKMSLSRMGRVSPNKGKKMSEETKRKISEATKGRKKSLQTRKRMSIAQQKIHAKKI